MQNNRNMKHPPGHGHRKRNVTALAENDVRPELEKHCQRLQNTNRNLKKIDKVFQGKIPAQLPAGNGDKRDIDLFQHLLFHAVAAPDVQELKRRRFGVKPLAKLMNKSDIGGDMTSGSPAAQN